MGKEAPVVVYALSSAARQFVPETHRRRAHTGMLKALAHRCYRVVHLGFLSRPRTQVSGSSPIKKIAFVKMGRNAKGSEGLMGSGASERTDGWT
jgi:hypothetical protein